MKAMTTISLDDDLAKELQALADREGKNPTDLVRQLLAAYTERQRYLAAIDEGLADIKAGRVVDGEEVEAFLDDWARSP
jgi:predicted transcriptional regulator